MSHPAFSLSNLAVITGGASGIGLAFARKWASMGMRIAVLDRDITPLEDGKSDIPEEQLRAFVCDVSDYDAVQGSVAEIIKWGAGVPSVLFNNAGAGMNPGKAWENPDGWRQLANINLFGVMHSVAAFLPAMLESGKPGVVINTGSKQGMTNPPGAGAYNLSKAGVVNYTQTLARELREAQADRESEHISAHLLIPGFTYTGMIRRFIKEKPPAAWTSEELVEYASPRIERGDFYILCPDNDVSRELDIARLQWHADEVAENRPALSRWHADYEGAFAHATAQPHEPHTSEPSKVWTTHTLDSANPYEFSDIVQNLADAPPQKVAATLLRPPRASEPVPCVIALHGSMGWRGHHHEHAVGLLEQGIAVLRVHSFESRNVADVVGDQLSVTAAMMLHDAFTGLRLLQSLAEIDSQRIGIAGWSLGGQVALYAALEQVIEALSKNGERFAAHAPVYPAAHITPQDNRWSSAPIHVFTGEADDYTPVHFIRELVPQITAGGGNIALDIYPDAHHSFDSPDPLNWIPHALRLGKRGVEMDAQGNMHYTSESGETFALNSKEDREKMFAATKNVGAHTGVEWRAREACMHDLPKFFQTAFGMLPLVPKP